MHLVWVVACRSYELRDDGTVDIEGAGIDSFVVEELPIQCELRLVFRVGLIEGEETDLELDVLGPGMQLLGPRITLPLRGVPPPDHRPGYMIPVVRATTLRIEAEHEGIYSVEVYSDGRSKASVFFDVRLETAAAA